MISTGCVREKKSLFASTIQFSETLTFSRWTACARNEKCLDSIRVSPCTSSFLEDSGLKRSKVIIVIMVSRRRKMMRYLVETDYLSGSWMRTKEQSFASVATAAGTFAHLRGGEFSRRPWTRWCRPAVPSQIHSHVSRAHLRLYVLADPSESSNVS